MDEYPLLSSHPVKLPDAEVKYFNHPDAGAEHSIAVVVACYNEEQEELHRTLFSLSRQRSPRVALSARPTVYKHRICLIFDGIERMSHSMKKYLCAMYASTDLTNLLFTEADRLLREMKDAGEASTVQAMTYFVQSRIIRLGTDARGNVTFAHVPREQMEPGDLDISLILKLENRLKHNSHEWGFMAFARDTASTYVFASDVGTLFAKKCLYLLAHYLDRHHNVSAVTGRQRVMTVKQQKSEELWYSLARWYRAAQCYDYESSFASFMAAFHLAGMLPVIPGPCGMSRRADMDGEPWRWYFETVHTPPEEQDLILGNLLLAEDRVLCYAAALKTEKPRFTALVPTATFYFAAETNLKTLAFQRRRWINGTVAGYIYLGLLNPGLIFRSQHSWLRKILMWLLIMCQLLMFGVVALSPALFLISFRLSLQELWPLVSSDSGIYTDLVWAIAVASYIAFVLRHRWVNFEAFLFYWMLFLNTCTIALTFAMTARAVASDGIPEFWNDPFGQKSMTYYLFVLVIVCTLFPVFNSLFTGGGSFYFMVRNIVPFYLFLPTLVSSFGAYAFSRTFDLSWGNRPPSELKPDAFVDNATKMAIEKAQQRLKEQSQASCGFILMLNLMTICITLMSLNLTGALLALGFLVFFSSFVQMIISLIWFLRFFVTWLFSQVLLGLVVCFACRWAACCKCWCAWKEDQKVMPIWYAGFDWEEEQQQTETTNTTTTATTTQPDTQQQDEADVENPPPPPLPTSTFYLHDGGGGGGQQKEEETPSTGRRDAENPPERYSTSFQNEDGDDNNNNNDDETDDTSSSSDDENTTSISDDEEATNNPHTVIPSSSSSASSQHPHHHQHQHSSFENDVTLESHLEVPPVPDG